MQDLQHKFREHPGCRERHLRRKLDNPLFPAAERHKTMAELDAEQRLDDDELSAFLKEVKDLVTRVGSLSPDSNVQDIVELKTRVDDCYEQCLGLPGDQGRVKSALIKLITELTRLNMETLQDGNALKALRDEQAERLAHFTRLEFPVTGDICRRQSPLAEGELVPTLLSEAPDALAAALGLFHAERLALIRDDARALIAQRREEGFELPAADDNLALIVEHVDNAAA